MKVSNEELYEMTSEISAEIFKRRWRWIGHVLRKGNDDNAVIETQTSSRIKNKKERGVDKKSRAGRLNKIIVVCTAIVCIVITLEYYFFRKLKAK